MSWIAVGVAGASAGLQALSIGESNKAVGRQFVKNTKQVKDSLNRQYGQLQEMGQSIQDDIALEQSKVKFEALQLSATTTNNSVERGVVGKSVARAHNQSSIVATNALNALKKTAEDKAVEIGVEMENAKDRANEAIYKGEAMAQSQTVSGLKAVSSVAQAGLSGFSLGKGIN